MSVGSQSFSPGGPNGIIRSQSFAGFTTQQERRSRCHSFIGNNGAVKKPQGKSKKMNSSSHKNSSSSKDIQPKRMEEMYDSLKKGLSEYLEFHQAELDKLTTQLKDMKSNSRLVSGGFSQIKSIERYVRRLEFHISKVDELYEAFCIQKRLREGAAKMKQAFSSSPSTKGARESLAEINRSYKEYTEVTNTMAFSGFGPRTGTKILLFLSELFIFMRYGRQRWKLKGKIEANDRQSWDGEDMIFLPLINELFSIKVSELKGLATHLLVGSVTCETKDLFTARPQLVAVDINDLGTVKLNLEVTWYPFDKEDLTPSTGNLNKATSVQRRCSIYSQNTPDTPTFEDYSFFKCLQPPEDRLRLSFIDVLRDTFFDKLRRSRSFSDLPSLRLRSAGRLELYVSPDNAFENGILAGEKSMSLSYSHLANGTCITTPTLTSAPRVYSNPEITVTPPNAQDEDSGSQTSTSAVDDAVASPEEPAQRTSCRSSFASDPGEEERDNQAASSMRAEHDQCAPDRGNEVFLESDVAVGLLQDSDEMSDLKPVELDTYEGNLTKQLVKRLTSAEKLLGCNPQEMEGFITSDCEGMRPVSEMRLEEALQGLFLALEPHKERYKELHDLEQELLRLEDLLKCKPSVNRSRSSSLSLTVESALESFDFLNTSDFDDDDDGGDGPDSECSDIEHPEARGHLSEALTEDTGVGTSVAGSPLPLTTGYENLDFTIAKHLQHCDQLLQVLTLASSIPLLRLLEKISQQALVLENMTELSTEKVGSLTSAVEVIPRLQEQQALLSLWIESCGSGNVFYAPVEKLMKQITLQFAETVNKRCPGHSDTVIRILMNQMLDRPEPLPASSLSQVVVTIFQFDSYLTSHNLTNLGDHLEQLANEVSLVLTLQSSHVEMVLQKLRAETGQNLQPLQETLKAIAFLLLEASRDLVQATTSFLVAASLNKNFREKAVMYYTEALTQPNVKMQRAACTALKCIKMCESIDILVSLCQSEREVIRQSAAESLLSLGEEGRLAYEQLDKVPQEIVRLAGRRSNAVSTAF
uniref:Rho family-interacting cell polarization regulator 2 n=1 Tax=Callorhinchus milii TaxID=7868 RepID=A0A4W3IRG8_CALMI